ncbi:SulP family inorganic anion transporter [Leadbetterella byssophila]|uniref:SulP family inorganic anion transporter n=1 Tax=Leadbetterella byssophila TaxID=316068 RepID=UPI0039A05903
MKSKYLKNLKYDLPAGLVVFLVALPLCLGISLASGAPFFSGIIAGVIGGIVIGALSNSQLSVSGPAAGLVAIIISAISTLGTFEAFLLAVVLAGAFQVVLGFLKAGVLAYYFPSNVIKGMLSGIGIIIILKQIPHALGYDVEGFNEMTNFIKEDGSTALGSLFSAFDHISLGATLICFIALGIIIAFESPKLKAISKLVPGGLVAVVVSVLVSELIFKSIPSLQIEQEHLVNVPVANSFNEVLGLFTFPDFSKILDSQIWIVALTITAVASIETLLCIEAVDQLDPQKRFTNNNRELVAQGIGNISSGLIGGLPITSVIVRSSANLNANAKTKVSTIFHGVLLFASVLLIPTILNKIPLSSLAAILIFTGYKLAKPSIFKEMFSNGKYQWKPFVVTVASVVIFDLLIGVGVGLAFSVYYILKGNFKNSFFYQKSEDGPIRMVLSEEVSFLNKANIKESLEAVPKNSSIIIDATNSTYIDFDVLQGIKEFVDYKSKYRNIECQLIGFDKQFSLTEVPAAAH